MSPTPSELEPQGFRRPVTLLYQVIGEGRYPWLLDSLRGKKIEGFLFDSSSSKGLCVHLVTGWSREGRSHKVVHCGDDFKKTVFLEEPYVDENIGAMGIMIHWGGITGEKFYGRGDGERIEGDKWLFILRPFSNIGNISNLTFKELEEGFLRAAGRLLE